MCFGFSLVTNVRIVSRVGQKRLLNALNVNVNVKMEESDRETAGRIEM